MLPLLHRWDPVAPADTCVNLMVVWLKALSGNRRDGAGDGGISYSFLPKFTRWLVSPFVAWLYPRLHHQNIAMRTAFLDRVVAEEPFAAPEQPVALVALGAGFDGRSLRFGSSSIPCYELDLPAVIEQKRGLVARASLRLPKLTEGASSITYVSANLSDVSAARRAVRQTMLSALSGRRGGRVVVVCEALLIYLPAHSATQLLRAVADEATSAGAASISFCFADALPGVEGIARWDAEDVLRAAGLHLDPGSWTPKPGLARHMGVARKD